jgi:hypothetical protein
MVRTFLKVNMELGSYFLFLQEQIKNIIIIISLVSDSGFPVAARTNKRHHYRPLLWPYPPENLAAPRGYDSVTVTEGHWQRI